MHNFDVRVPERGSLGTRLLLLASFPGLQSPNAVEGARPGKTHT